MRRAIVDQDRYIPRIDHTTASAATYHDCTKLDRGPQEIDALCAPFHKLFLRGTFPYSRRSGSLDRYGPASHIHNVSALCAISRAASAETFAHSWCRGDRGVHGSGKSSVAEEIAYLLEQRGDLALLDLDYLSWAGTGTDDRAAEVGLMLRNLAAVTATPAGRNPDVRACLLCPQCRRNAEDTEALGLPLRVVRLTVPIADIEQRLAGDVTSGRRDDLRQAASSIAAAEGAGVEDVAIGNDRPIGVVARNVMSFLDGSR